MSAQLVADRVETKYALDHRATRLLMRELQQRLPLHRFTGEGANVLPDPQHFVTSIYFDTASHAHYRAALQDRESNTKLRARTYYDVLPSLAELATDASQIVRSQPWFWLELKQCDRGRSRKARVRIAADALESFFRGDHRVEDGELATVLDYVRSVPEPFLPSCVVNYRRIALQDDAGTLRITLDVDVAYYAAPSDLYTRGAPLVRAALGSPACVEPGALLEIKRVGAPPSWLEDVVRGLGVQPLSYSKFVHAARAVHG